MSIRRVLIANRGEIAVRIARACREEGITSIAVVAADEQDPLHGRYADECVTLVSEMPLAYLDADAVLAAALASRADAIHPGYGFMAENATFARACAEVGITFIGPSPDAIDAMGDKIRARDAAVAAGVPVVAGTGEATLEDVEAFAAEVGYPIAVKASAGGGGRGFRVAWNAGELANAYSGASGEAQRYFNNPTVYAERYYDHPRHIEIQVMADQHGNVVALGERDCSIQRRHQKLIEESPSPAVDADLRAAMNATCVALARAVNYVGAGTVEFLVQDGEFVFLEMNTRIQVEHPVTELVTGIDLVREQLRVAAGERLSFDAIDAPWGHAIEVRINAEDPARDFQPMPGPLLRMEPPGGFGVRVDTGFTTGGVIDPRFDSLIAKLIAWGRDRSEAISRLDRALADFVVEGVPTPIALYRSILRHETFIGGDYDTRFLEHTNLARHTQPFEAPNAEEQNALITVEVNGRAYRVRLPEDLRGISATGAGNSAPRRRAASTARASGGSTTARGNDLVAPIQGTVLRVAVSDGDTVEAGQVVCVVEAMKMENELSAHQAGVVSGVSVQVGASVSPGQVVLSITPATPA
jgi:acetyl-CoA/propionyl-CoA carboxylase biotin carboxyl carrier protein